MTDDISVEDIDKFIYKSTRTKNDETNKLRENIISRIFSVPEEYLSHPTYGERWRLVQDQFIACIKKVSKGIVYTSVKLKHKGGRGHNHDFDILYYNEDTSVLTIPFEFKYGASSINKLPQFLSLQAKYKIFEYTYDVFYYMKYLNEYMKTDPDITVYIPSLEDYLKYVTSTTPNVHRFFAQLAERENYYKKEKNTVVNNSIREYLSLYGHTIDLDELYNKIAKTQKNKMYMLWFKNELHFDELVVDNNMIVGSIKNGNVLHVKSGNTTYNLLLRWRNHKGILNPAWQISLTRSK
jgi:hypothetical protein